MQYSLLKGVLKAIRPAVLAGVAGGVGSEGDLPVTALSAVCAWILQVVLNYLKHRKK